jgi:pimeloyl-ACP methyl ester carboxylesterase
MTGMDGNKRRVEEVSVGFELGTIEDLRLRLSRSRRAPDLGQGWERGAPSAWTAELVDDWYRFDIDPLQARLTVFGGERVPFPKPPRELAERFYNVTDWSEHPVGGHFPAVAEPEILANVIRRFFRPLR